jgi:hypothetical protein
MGPFAYTSLIRLICGRPASWLRAWVIAYRHAHDLTAAYAPTRRLPERTTPPAPPAAIIPPGFASSIVPPHEAPCPLRMTGKGKMPYVRADGVTADLVEVGLLFTDVFGRHQGEDFFRCTSVPPHVYRRVLLGPARMVSRRGDDTGLVTSD